MASDNIVRLKLILNQSEYNALLKSCEHSLRTPDAEARHIIRHVLQRVGFLPIGDEVDHEAL